MTAGAAREQAGVFGVIETVDRRCTAGRDQPGDRQAQHTARHDHGVRRLAGIRPGGSGLAFALELR